MVVVGKNVKYLYFSFYSLVGLVLSFVGILSFVLVVGGFDFFVYRVKIIIGVLKYIFG